MFDWIMQNWILITAISGGLWLIVHLLERFTSKGKKKNENSAKQNREPTIKDVDIEDAGL